MDIKNLRAFAIILGMLSDHLPKPRLWTTFNLIPYCNLLLTDIKSLSIESVTIPSVSIDCNQSNVTEQS